MHWSVIGHERQKMLIERLIRVSRLAHAYLFSGPPGVGKRMFADDIVHALVPAGYEPDAMAMAYDVPVDEVRAMKRWIYLRPAGTYKVVVIDDVDRISGEAANTLLKVLEEPPSYAKFFLITGRAGAVMPTISSRCERMDFMPLGDADMKSIFAGLKLDADDCKLLSVVAGGRPGLALRLVNDKKLPGVARHIAAFEKVLKGGVTERILYAKEVADADDADEIADWWLSWVHAHLTERPALAPVARGLAQLVTTLREPHYNRRLALESFFLVQ